MEIFNTAIGRCKTCEVSKPVQFTAGAVVGALDTLVTGALDTLGMVADGWTLIGNAVSGGAFNNTQAVQGANSRGLAIGQGLDNAVTKGGQYAGNLVQNPVGTLSNTYNSAVNAGQQGLNALANASAYDAGLMVGGVAGEFIPSPGKVGKVSKLGDKSPDVPPPKPKDGTVVQAKPKPRSKRVGDCAEGLTKQDLKNTGFDEVISIENGSGNGVDLIGRNSTTGEVKVLEVKGTEGDTANSLSKHQRNMGGADFTADRLNLAANNDKNFKNVAQEVSDNAKKAQDWIKKSPNTSYEKVDVFVDDIDKGCSKKKPSKRSPWVKK